MALGLGWGDGARGRPVLSGYADRVAVRRRDDRWGAPRPVDERAALETELQAEVAEGHPLFGEHVIAIARCEGCDEVIFSVETDPVRLVSVHLTWGGAPERSPWPRAEDVSLPLSRSLAEHEH
jgi:hypothetical protein